MMRRCIYIIAIIALWTVSACQGTPSGLSTDVPVTSLTTPVTEWTTKSASELIGGPAATGRVGDILLANDRVKVLIAQPGKYPAIYSFGGGIIDADRVRPAGEAGQDNFGALFPLVNVEWTVNVTDITTATESDGTKVVRASGLIDVYDYLDVDFLEPISGQMVGQSLYYSSRFDDMNNPFSVFDLKNINPAVTTEYRLAPHSNVVTIRTSIENRGDQSVAMPFGDFVNGSGEVELLIPGLGYSPALLDQVSNAAPGIIYSAFPGNDVSYGYFYSLDDWMDAEKSFHPATSLSFSGVTGMVLGEKFLEIFPLGGGSDVKIFNAIPAHSTKTFTRYFVIGDQSAGSVMDAALNTLNIQHRHVDGIVTDRHGHPVEGARVAIQNEGGKTVVTLTTDGSGHFSGNLSTGAGAFGRLFGSGHYSVEVYKPGYLATAGHSSGICTPAKIALTQSDATGIHCEMGHSAVVTVVGGVKDKRTHTNVPARLTIVGFDQSPSHTDGASFSDNAIFSYPFGIVDVRYINAKGGFDLSDSPSFRLEPGRYIFVFSRGFEYSADSRIVDIPTSGEVKISNVILEKSVPTPGYVAVDFHLHSIASPDSSVSLERRALQASCEGMDILQSSDHDTLADYKPAVARLVKQGILPPNSLLTVVGDEISPNGVGHIHAFPLDYHPEKPAGGAIDWSASPIDTIGPEPDYLLSIQDIIDTVLQDPGEEVIQINHIADSAISLPVITGLVTSTLYQNDFNVDPLSSYADPIMMRFEPMANTLALPISYQSNPFFSHDFTAIELCIGPELSTNKLRESSLPQWFNMLNLGALLTASGNSDSHTAIDGPVGLPRNFVASSIDPQDGMGKSQSTISEEEYAKAINNHRLTISGGVFVTMSAKSDNGDSATIGDTLSGHTITLTVTMTAPSWTSFDTLDIFANTEPIPASDDTIKPMRGVAQDPADFYKPYHLTKYTYEPMARYSTLDDTLSVTEKEGLMTATKTITLKVKEDTWIVAMASGSPDNPEFRSIFPVATSSAIRNDKVEDFPETFTLDDFHHHPDLHLPAWGLTNPIFVDVDGDTNHDGELFEAKYIRMGISPLGQAH